MSIFNLIALASILFTVLLISPTSVCQMEVTKVGVVEDDREFAGLQETWEKVHGKLQTLLFFNRSNCSDIQDEELTLPERRTLMAAVALPCFFVLFLVMICCICSRRFFCKSDVPPYLTVHFPLYQNAADSRGCTPPTPTNEGQFDSLSYSFPNGHVSRTTHCSQYRCP